MCTIKQMEEQLKCIFDLIHNLTERVGKLERELHNHRNAFLAHEGRDV